MPPPAKAGGGFFYFAVNDKSRCTESKRMSDLRFDFVVSSFQDFICLTFLKKALS